MQLYIVRHAPAGQHGDPNYPDDGQRPLTPKGEKRFRKAVKKLARRGFAPVLIATSPLVRCRQTAEVISQRVFPTPELVELDALLPGSQLEALAAWSNQRGVEELAWVGHAPDVDDMAAALIGGSASAIEFAKGAVAAIDFDDHIVAAGGTLRWMATLPLLGC